MKTSIFILLLNLQFLFYTPLHAQIEIENFKPDANSVSLGGSLVSQARDPAAIYWNPALLAGFKDRAVLFSMVNPFEYNFLGFTQFVPLYGTFGIGLSRVPGINDTSLERGTFAWGRRLNKWLSFGAGMSVEKKDIEMFATTRLGIYIGNPVIGTLDNPWRDVSNANKFDRINFGVSVQNIPIIENNFETAVLFGFSYLFPTAGFLINTGYHMNEIKNTSHMGFGYEITRRLKLSAGIEQFNVKKLGIGFSLSYENFLLQFSYSSELDKMLLTASTRIGADPRKTANLHLRRGRLHLGNKNFNSASREFKKYLSYDFYNVNRDSLKRLITAIDKVYAVNSTIVDSLLLEVRKLLSEREPKFLRAAVFLQRIKELDPDNLEARTKLAGLKPLLDKYIKDSIEIGKTKYELNQYLDAKKMFSRVLVFDGSNTEANYYISVIDKILLKLGEEHFAQGVGYYNQKNYGKAKAEFELALEYNAKLENVPDYLKQVNDKIELEKSRINQLIIEAEKLENSKDYVGAVNKYLAILKQTPDNRDIKSRLVRLSSKVDRYLNQQNNEAVIAYQNGNIKEAMSIINHILSINPDHRDARRNLIKLKEENKNRVESYLRLGDTYFERKDFANAEIHYNNALEYDPDNIEALERFKKIETMTSLEEKFTLAKEYNKNARYLEAYNLLKNLVTQYPENAEIKNEFEINKRQVELLADNLFNNGIKLYTEDKYEEAIKELNKVLQYLPDHKGANEYIKKAEERVQALKSFNNK